VKKSVAFFLTLPLALTGAGVFLSAPGVLLSAADSVSYLDIGSGITSLTASSFYMLGVYQEESGVPYVYLLGNRNGNITAEKTPCLSSSDATHPYGIAESDFRKGVSANGSTSSGLYAPFMAYDLGSGTYSFSFGTNFGNLHIDTTNSALSAGTDSSYAVTPTLSEDGSHSVLSLSNLEASIATSTNEVSFTYGSDTSTSSTTYVTNLLLYPLPETQGSVFEKEMAVGFGKGIVSGHFDTTNAKSTYQAMSYVQRSLYASTSSSSQSDLACAAVTKLIGDSWNGTTNSYISLSGSDSLDFHALDASGLSVDYTNDTLIGMNPEESYSVSYSGISVHLYPGSAGTSSLVGTSDNNAYDFCGADLSIKIYGTTTTESLNALTLSVLARTAAPTSVTTTLASIPTSPTENVDGLYSDEIIIAPESNMLYCIASVDTPITTSNYLEQTWTATPDFTGLNPEARYLVYKRISSTTAPDSYPLTNADGLAQGQDYTTLSALEGMRRHTLVALYSFYQTSYDNSVAGSDHANLLAMLNALDTKVNATTTTDDLGIYLTDYSQAAFNYAQTQDSQIVDLKKAVALLSSDSDASRALLASTIQAISALSYFASDDVTTGVSKASDCEWKIEGYRYRESKAKDLVTLMNSLLQTSGITAAQKTSLWSTYDSVFEALIAADGTDLATLKSNADTLYNQAVTSLKAILSTGAAS
jgi:hypothetical protein